MAPNFEFSIEQPPETWERLGLIIDRGVPGEFDSSVTGDPCVVWNEARNCYHMFYFAQKHGNRKDVNSNAHAVSLNNENLGPGNWKKLGPLIYANPEALCGETHKPWILMDPYHPNIAVKIEGKYWLFTVSFRGHNKVIQLATSISLDGAWEVNPTPVIDIGPEDAHDGYHVDAVTAFWFEKRNEILLFHMAYPQKPQVSYPHSPYGNGSAVAVMGPNDKKARKLGRILNPSPNSGCWTGGWVGGMQILPAASGGWYGLCNASPTPPVSVKDEPSMREPAPSLGGWAYTPETWPVKGWQAAEQPIEWVEDIPLEAIQVGEGINLWRHHLVVLPNRELYLFYNTGPYGQERMFGRRARLK